MSLINRLGVLSFVLLIVAGAASAQATRTWISGVGDDVNPCSRTAPCKTFAGAISKTAKGGEINCLDPGGYGAVTITKSITLDCTGTQGSILASLTTGIIINITDETDTQRSVRIRGLNINGASTGLNAIRIMKATSVSIENTVVDGFTLSALSVETAAKVLVSGVTFRNNGTGITAGTGSMVHVFGSRIFGNKVGITGATIISYKNNMISGNDSDGLPTSSVNTQ